MKAYGFPRRFRLRRRREFLVTQRRGRKFHAKHFLVFVLPIDAAWERASSSRVRGTRVPASEPARSMRVNAADDAVPSRIGITVTRKVGNAVTRNRIKRLVRESFRHKRVSFPPGFAMVWVAKRSAGELQYADALAAMEQLSRQMRGYRRGRGRQR